MVGLSIITAVLSQMSIHMINYIYTESMYHASNFLCLYQSPGRIERKLFRYKINKTILYVLRREATRELVLVSSISRKYYDGLLLTTVDKVTILLNTYNDA